MSKDQRLHERIDVRSPLKGWAKIIRVDHQNVLSNKTMIMVLDIGKGGLRFQSGLRFPVARDILLSFHVVLFGKPVHIQGKIVRNREINPHLFEYGVKFSSIDVGLFQALDHFQRGYPLKRVP